MSPSPPVSSCPGGGFTTLTGTVFAPNGTLPLYNAIVYVPSSAVAPFPQGATCDPCNGKVSGNPIVQTLTGPDGTFTLQGVPTGNNIPLVIQLGKWRRELSVPTVPNCQTTHVDPTKTRLPRNAREGDMPKMAIATGALDPFECLLLKIGIDPTEIQEPPGAGVRVSSRIHFYAGEHRPGTVISSVTPTASQLYSSLNNLMNYDIVMLPCEGAEFDQGTAGSGLRLSPDPRGLLVQYVNSGGRVFTTHYSYDWLTYPNSPFNQISQPLTNGLWDKDQRDYPSDTVPLTANLVTNFPKGQAFAQWLTAAGASSAPNTLAIEQIRHDIDGLNTSLAQQWATDTMPDGKPGIAHLTFNLPFSPPTIDNQPQYCGRVIYSDFHVAQSEADLTSFFPAACHAGPLSDQEKALAFMLFDLSSCVQADNKPPIG
jgi:hypothetical protein